MSTKSTDAVIAYFEDVSLAPTSLRIDGLIKPFTDWDHLRRACILVTDQQLLEVKRASHNFMRDANREYDRRVREVNKPTQSPINFAFTTNYDDDSVPKCPFCRTYLFPQEVSKKMWCCGGGRMLDMHRPWTQPTE
jgi:hypothetical protein